MTLQLLFRPGAMPAARARHVLALVSLALLAACGGGGGGGDTTPVPPVTPATLQISGTAAIGKALAAAAVDARCGSGSGTATTAADGSFSVPVAGGSLPCMLRVTSGGTVLHAVANGTGAAATANISPLTELVLAQAASGQPADLFANFDATAQSKVTAAALSTATAAVATALQGTIDLAGVNPFTDRLVAATAGAPGNALDGKLDVLASTLGAAKLTLADVAKALTSSGASAGKVLAGHLKPAAATCASLHSGDYVEIDPVGGSTKLITIDAVALTSRQTGVPPAASDTANAAVPVEGRPCHFRTNGGQEDVVVGSAGVMLNRFVDDTSGLPRAALILPRQGTTLADMAGTWNTVEFIREASGYVSSYAQASFTAAGAISVQDCLYLQPCGGSLQQVQLSQRTDGGYDVTGNGDNSTRLYAFRSLIGEMIFVSIGSTGNLIVGSKVAAAVLPRAGDISTYWDLTLNVQGTASALTADVRSITAVDTAAATFSRGAGYGGVVDTFQVNSPRTGLRTRAASTCKTTAGTAVNCAGLISMPLAGMGMAVYGSAVSGTSFYGFSITRPAGSTATGVQSVGGNTPTTPSAAPGTLVDASGEVWPLRASMTISAGGQITGGFYDFHKLDGTQTPCTHSAANTAVCHGTSANFSVTSQSGPMTTAGAATGISLVAGPDIYGYTFTGTLSGVRWTGTWTKQASTLSPTPTGGGSFSVDLAITQP